MQHTPRIAHWLRITTALTSTLGFVIALGSSASANPVDGQVAAGDATISAPDTKTVQVDQASQNAVINWQSFDIASDETTRFVQPSAASWTLNRVTGSTSPTSILGTLTANGNLAIVNPDGILFGQNARIDVGGLIATTNDIRDTDFMSGNFAFTQPGNPSASIVNEGNISIADYGIGAFVAPGLRNAGVITANMGTVSLASGNAFTLDLYGDNLVRLVVGDEIASEVVDAATGAPMDDLVKNEGAISADGGTVALTAATARKAVNSVVNNTGIIEARSVGMRNGKIVLGGQTASTKTADAPTQVVKVSGDITVADAPFPSPRPADWERGKVVITGEAIEISDASIDATGVNGGGTILIGGDYLGGQANDSDFAKYGIDRETDPIPTASYAFLDGNSELNADAIAAGDGGKIVVWSDIATETAATITARGGAIGGDGGFIETSGNYLNATVAADASAPNGEAGTWLLDPLDIYISRTATANVGSYFGTYRGLYGLNAYPIGSSSYVDTFDIEAALNAGTNVMITTVGTSGAAHGDIHVMSDIRKTSGGNVALGMDSARNIYLSVGVDLVSTSGSINASLFAPNGQITGYNVGQISLDGGTLYLQGGQGITLSSSYDMPNLSLGPDYLAPNVVITFDQDLIRFSHNGSLATIPSGGIRLVDPTATGGLYINFGSLNYALQDYAIRIVNQRSWALVTDSGAFGAFTANGLNRIPEVVSDGAVNTRFSSAIPQVNGVYPVWEVSSTDAPNCYGLTCLAASPYGQKLIDALTMPPESTPIVAAKDTAEESASPQQPRTPVLPVSEPTGTNITPALAQKTILYAKLSQDVEGVPTALPSGTRRIADWQTVMRLSGVSEGEIRAYEIAGLDAAVYRTEGGEIVVAYGGTKKTSVADWATNFGVRLVVPPQYAAAAKLAELVAQRFGRPPSLTGHSLGGALASYAASKLSSTGPVVTFNADRNSLSLSGNRENQINIAVAGALIGDPNIGEYTPFVRSGQLPGKTYYVGTTDDQSNLFAGGHGIGGIIGGMENLLNSQ